MNIVMLRGISIYSFGLLQEQAGRLLGNTKLQTGGTQKQTYGRYQMVVGDARRIIERCKKKQKKSISSQLVRTTAN